MEPISQLHPSEGSLPTLSKLGITTVPTVNAREVASAWLSAFSAAAAFSSVSDLLSLLLPSAYSSNSESNERDALSFYWRDILALTWDFRTFEGTKAVHQFLLDRLEGAQITNVRLQEGSEPAVWQPYPDLVWLLFLFTFETDTGLCSGVVKLVPFPNGDKVEWKAHSIFTNLESLKGHPEQIGALRNSLPNHGRWEEERRRETRFADGDPPVLIIGGGQSGLEIAARLKCLGIKSLIIEKNERIGDNWRYRYEALCLHDPVWFDHLPYLPFPPTWPVYTPAKKLANWLEHYADVLELNVWTSSAVTQAKQDPITQLWTVTVRGLCGDVQKEKKFTVKHLIFAMAFNSGTAHIPHYPGMDNFKGQILHSLNHHKATDHAGKKVVVVGSCTSAHDICVDYYNHGIDVTMYQRGSTYIMSTKNGIRMLMEGLYDEHGPPTEVADLINASFPNHFSLGMAYRLTNRIAVADKELLEGLKKVGFRMNMGHKDAGFMPLVWTKAGGYYLNVGGSELIIDGKIKLKSDSTLSTFTEKGLKFEDGSEIDADVVVFCTGLGSPHDAVRRICGDAVADKVKPIWGLNSEGEVNGAWRDLGLKGLWYMMGNLALARFHSKHVALQIKAMEEGLFGKRYALKE